MNYYGDNVRWFVGEVIDVSPPYGLEGRVRVRIHGVHNPSTREVKQNDLPWAQCVLPTTEGGVSGVGSVPKLEAGALVFGFFVDGKQSQVPIILGSLPKIEYPSAVQQSLAFQDLLERVDPDVEFYNKSISTINEDNPSLKNYTTETITAEVSAVREATAVKFFLSNNYTLKQSCALTAAISHSNPYYDTQFIGQTGKGLLQWPISSPRYARLKQFNSQFDYFSVQLAFILYELNTTHVEANIRILQSDIIDPRKGKALGDIITRYYLPSGLTINKAVKTIYDKYSGI